MKNKNYNTKVEANDENLSPQNNTEIETFNEEDYPKWKKIEIEILRDRDGNSICIGSREFVNSVISVFPILTIPNNTFQIIRAKAINIADTLRIVGNINLKFIVNQNNYEFKLIEYSLKQRNTLIEKASKYSTEKILPRLEKNELLCNIFIDGKRICYEPIIKDVILDINNKSMVFGKNLEECIIKASYLNKGLKSDFRLDELIYLEKNELEIELTKNEEDIFFAVAEAIRKEMSVEKICDITNIDKYFIGSIYKIVKIEKELALNYIDYKLILKATNIGFTMNTISMLSGKDVKELQRIILKNISNT